MNMFTGEMRTYVEVENGDLNNSSFNEYISDTLSFLEEYPGTKEIFEDANPDFDQSFPPIDMWNRNHPITNSL